MNKEIANGANKGKDVIYIDVDDEITGIIEKVQSSAQRIVALVLPKRATMLQSVVNMKLLKRAGDTGKKHIVLITSEAGLMPLAGSVGLHVAKSLQSRPEIPEGPLEPADSASDAIGEPTADAAAGAAKVAGAEPTGSDDDEAIELDNATDDTSADAAATGGAQGAQKGGKKFKIPNFSKFRTWILLGGLGTAVLIGFVIWALIVLPRAEVVITTDSSAITSSREITLIAGDDAELDAEEGVLPARSEEIVRTQRQEVEATGEDNQGDHASGEVVMVAGSCSGTAPSAVPAGTAITANNLTFITQSSASFSPDFNPGSGQCRWASGDIDVEAQNPGHQYNTSATTFSVAGRSGVSAQASSAMSGGTDDIVKIVTQADIDRARDRIEESESGTIEQELERALRESRLYPIPETYHVTTADTDASAEPGDEADTVTVTEEVTYTMLGVQLEELEQVIAADVADDIDTDLQTILDYGLDEATFTLQNRQESRTMVGLRTVVVAGPDLDVEEIKEEVAGKKASEARSIIEVNPGVTNVEVTYGPFWVRSIPRNTDKITIVVEEPDAVQERTEDTDDDAQATED